MRWIALICLLAATSCVGGSFGNHQDIEEYPLRSADKEEAKDLKRCLNSAHHEMEAEKHKTGKYPRKISELPLDDACNDFLLAMKKGPEGFLITAKLNKDDTTVRWTVNQDGRIEEYLDPEMDDDLEF